MNYVIFILLFVCQFAFGSDFSTTAEKTQFKETGRYQESLNLCQQYARSFPKDIRCVTYGRTPENRMLHALIVKGAGAEANSPVIWAQAGIHAGEIDGKDAGYLLLKEIFVEKKYPTLLKGLWFIFVPIVNVDGHERFEKYNRPNQVGPAEMGWRTTSENFNLNRDFAKLDSQEMQAMLKLWHQYDPVLSLDLHVTDGAQFQPEVGIIISPTSRQGKSLLHAAGSNLESTLMTKLKGMGRLALPFYPSFEEDDQPLSGFGYYVSTPRYSQGYWSNQNRLGMLVESHSWKDYPTRVKTHHDVLLSTLEIAQEKASEWRTFARAQDQKNLSGLEVDLEFKHTQKSKELEFPGYEFKITESETLGQDIVHYDPSKPQIWKVPLYEELAPSLTVKAPKEGYFVAPWIARWLKPKLINHGIRFDELKEKSLVNAEVFLATKTEFSPISFEGHQSLKVTGEWAQGSGQIYPGSIFIPIAQSKGLMVLQLLEPKSVDSYLSWGFMNAYFEQKEYMEAYVTEDVATEMLKDPKVKEEFEKKLEDKNFSKSSEARLRFFQEKHPTWDKRFNLYPIFRR